MAYNLFIAYDLDNPGQNYDAVHEQIKSLGTWYHAQQSLFYVHTPLSPQAAHAHVFAVMDSNDRLMVVDATNAVMYPAPPAHVEAINRVWFEPA
ncbi:hypothetical protein M2232_001830 [Bradyrhizobium japonicum]|uniref:hypothetical protein n=1 Tax=Bradyrhizobium japonicum TaxID=375 RepID=UPI002227F041|nr:hypothetical protein [Bradyrhizobium japonicum]MCW2218298.1 hypothetical protein [Bradyrhizobium japonicum]MCW2342912.1 hypothetical protein [Bradyrhizobium japonicum]